MSKLDFLLRYGKQVLAPEQWEQLLGVDIIDADGWSRDGKDFKEPIGLMEFVDRVAYSTIR